MVSALDRKLLRDLARLRTQALAIALVLACGVATVVMSFGAMQTLRETRIAYYERQTFAEIFAPLKRAPRAVEGEIAAIDGVARAQTRIVGALLVDVPGLAKPAVARAVSLEDDPAGGVNALVLRQGRFPDPARDGEVLLSEAFASANGFAPGDGVDVTMNGRKKRLTVSGVALSPEFVYAIAPGALVPDDRSFGVFFMPRRALEAAFDLDGAFNDVVASLLPGAREADVIAALDRLLAPYGAAGAYGREDQFSHAFVNHELDQLATMTMLIPPIFLGVAAFLIHIVVSRLVETEREQIGLLKAFGYTDAQVGAHYAKLVLVIVAAGLALGFAGGVWLGEVMTDQYRRFFRFPYLAFDVSPLVLLAAGGVAAGAALGGMAAAVAAVVRLAPAEAMRPAPPAVYRRTLAERAGLDRALAAPERMILRHLERWPFRALATAGGVAMSAALLVMTFYFFDAIEEMIAGTYFRAQRQDVEVAFVEARGPEVLRALAHLPGVRAVEPFRAAPVRLRHGPSNERIALQSLPQDPGLSRPMDASGRPVAPPVDGLLLSDKLARQLGVEAGAVVEVELLEGDRARRTVAVAAVYREYLGMGAYMGEASLRRLLGEGETASGARLLVDRDRMDALFAALKETPAVAGVSTKWEAIASFRNTMAESMLIVISFYVGFGGLIAAGVVYNAARISLSERGRELATLRVIGFTRAETAQVLIGELGILTLLAIPAGCVIGAGLAAIMSAAMDTELFRIPYVIYPATYGWAAVVVIAAAAAAAASVAWRVSRLDLIAVLKTRE